MSVINKMLRDLDARRADAAAPDLPRSIRSTLMAGTASVGLHPPRQRRATRWRLGLALLLLAATVTLSAYLMLLGEAPTLPPAATNVTAQTAPVPVAPASAAAPVPSPEVAPVLDPQVPAPASVASHSVAAPVPVAPVAPTAPVPRPTEQASRATSASVAATPTPPAQKQGTLVAAAPRGVSGPNPAAPPPATKPVQGTAVPAPSTGSAEQGRADVAAAAQRSEAAAHDTLARAQALWLAGSREPAVQLMREAVLVTERAQPLDAALLAELVREQVRMELALGHTSQVLDLLIRLEAPLLSQADLWAVRGNAAQRLGRHADAVLAYQKALQLRPGEQRWLLGAAVSLSAQGQLEAAAELAEQARALGPINPDVLKYLRQAGVTLR